MILKFLLYKTYEKMIASQDEHPFFRAYVYIYINIVFLFFSLFVLVQGTWRFLYKNEVLSTDVPHFKSSFVIILFLIFTTLYTYFRFFYRKDASTYIKKYKYHWLNKYFSSFILFFTPMLLFLIGPMLSVMLFGGTSFGIEFIGVFN